MIALHFITLVCDYHNKKKDYTKAFAWFYKTALENYTDAQFQVGSMYREGLGVPQDHTRANECYRKAYSNENTDAQWNIDVQYQNESFGVSANFNFFFLM